MNYKKDINQLILKRIQESESAEEIKKFLNEILLLELSHLGKPSWSYTEHYRKYIKELSKNYRLKKTSNKK